MNIIHRFNYWRRIIKAYITPSVSQLSFWHGLPEINELDDYNKPIPYYMKFRYKADYKGDFDSNGM